MQHDLARPDLLVPVLYPCTFCDILRPEVQPHSDDTPVHASGPHSACALAQARPTMSCIHLVIIPVGVQYGKVLHKCVGIFRAELLQKQCSCFDCLVVTIVVQCLSI